MKNLLIVAVIFLSCKSPAVSQDLHGRYQRKGKDYQYDLTLNSDSTFTLVKKYFEVNAKCSGKWHLVSDTVLLLRCDDEELSAKLQSGYMTERETRVIVINKKKLRIDKVIVRRE